VTEHGSSRGHRLKCPERSRDSRDTDRVEGPALRMAAMGDIILRERTREEVPVLWDWGARREAWEHARALAEPREEDAAIVMTDYQSFLSSSSSVRNLLPPPVLCTPTVLTAMGAIVIREPCMLGGPRRARLIGPKEPCWWQPPTCLSQLSESIVAKKMLESIYP
jgi:hypothetical protein